MNIWVCEFRPRNNPNKWIPVLYWGASTIRHDAVVSAVAYFKKNKLKWTLSKNDENKYSKEIRFRKYGRIAL